MDATLIGAIALFFLGSLPLLAYPMVLLAGIMTLAGHRTAETDRAAQRVAALFVWSTLLYPVAYGAALWACYHTLSGMRLGWALVPFFHLALATALFRLWGLTERRAAQKALVRQ